MGLILKGAPKSTSFVSISIIYFTHSIHRLKYSLEHQKWHITVELFLEKICYQISQCYKIGGSGSLERQKMSSVLLLKDLITNSSQGMIRGYQKCVDAQGSTSTDG